MGHSILFTFVDQFIQPEVTLGVYYEARWTNPGFVGKTWIAKNETRNQS